MPFTFAHPAIILPLKHLPKRWYSLAGLIIGSMTPDFEYFIRMQVKSIYSHTLPGLFWFDVPLGILLSYIYMLLIKDRVISNLPRFLNCHFVKYQYLPIKVSATAIAVMTCSVFIGSASHLLWDSFTHPHGYFVGLIPFLSTVACHIGHEPIYGYKLLQHGSTLIGLAVIARAIWLLPKEAGNTTGNVFKYWFVVILIAALITGTRTVFTDNHSHSPGNLLVTAIAGILIGLVIASATYPIFHKKL